MAGTFPAKFAEFMNGHEPDVFIETGTYDGKGVKQALKYGFRDIFTIEVSDANFQALVKNDKGLCGDRRVHRYLGSSRDLLQRAIDFCYCRHIVFWLDAHYQGISIEQRDKISECPLLDELKAIINTPWNDWVVKSGRPYPLICIDDANMFVDRLWDTDTDRHAFTRSDWPTEKEIFDVMHGWDYTADDNILYFYKSGQSTTPARS